MTLAQGRVTMNPGRMRAALIVESVSSSVGSATVEWRLAEGNPRYLSRIPFAVSYRWRDGRPVDFGEEGQDVLQKIAVFAFLGLALPPLCYDHEEVRVHTPFSLSEADIEYWAAVPKRVGLGRSKLAIDGEGPLRQLRYLRQPRRPDQVGLLYGGGVESLSALAGLLDRSPLLFATEGPLWMNNDTAAEIEVKRDLDKDLCERFGLEMVYAEINARPISQVPEPMMHYYCSGTVFYWLAAGVGLRLGIGMFQIAQELEITLLRGRWDRSLTPPQLFSGWHRNAPMMMPILGWAAKIELLDKLSRTDLLEYLYSCPINTRKRWCGECSKCRRIGRWCQSLGIPLEKIGMTAPPVPADREPWLSRFYDSVGDRTHPKRGAEAVEPWMLPITEIFLSDLVELSFYEADRARIEKDGDRLALSPEDRVQGGVLFPYVALEGHNRFTCRVFPPADAAWRLSMSILDETGQCVAETSVDVAGREAIAWRHGFSERFGVHTVRLAAHCTSGNADQPPVWDLPFLARAEPRESLLSQPR